MKKALVIMLMLSLAVGHISAQMQAVYHYATFYIQGQDQPYIETYLQFDAWTLTFGRTSEGVYRATVEVSIVASMGDSICFAKRYDLNSPTVGSLDELDFSFLDVQRFGLRNGIYNLKITLRDKEDDGEPLSVEDKVVLYYDNHQPRLSSVQLIAEARPTVRENILSRNGYDMEPYVSDFLPQQVEKLNFYYEVYNIATEMGQQPFVAMASIEVQETGSLVDGMRLATRKQAEPTVPVYGSIDITNLPSGNYNLLIELRNRDNTTMLYRRVPFFRSNPGVQPKEMSDFASTFAGRYNDPDELRLYIDALSPIASDLEREVISDLTSHEASVEEMQAFLYHFWVERNALTASSDWDKYKERIDYVQQHFSYPKTPGIHTDRGRVYLKYGPPDFVRDEKNYVGTATRSATRNNEAPMNMGKAADEDTKAKTAGHIHYLPYQLWRYNQLPHDDPDRVFLFWDEHRSGFYRLLNSNARGEIQESGWERRLSRNDLPENMMGEVGLQFERGY